MKKIFSLGLILATLLSLISPKPISAQTIATVSVSPGSTSVTVGSPVTVDVRIAGGTIVAAYQFRLNYNPAVFQIASTANVVNGSFLGSAAGRTITFSTPTIDTTTNPATVLVSAYSTGTLNTGANGAGILASVTFNTLSSAVNSPLTLSSVQVVMGDLDANLQTSTNVNSSVTVSGGITSTPNPSCLNTKSKGDADCDGKIDGVDFSKWLNSQCVPGTGQTCASYNADFNADSRVDDTDYGIWYTNRQ